MIRTLVVWLPDWPVTAAGFTAADAAAVFHANRVVACSEAARADGVRVGMRRREAQARCPSIVVLPDDPLRDAREFEPVVTAISRIAPRVEVTCPGMCSIGSRGPSRYFGGDSLLRDHVQRVVGRGCTVGIADGPFAAMLAARRSCVVPPGESASFLSSFPVSALERDELADLLRRLGIRTLGEFAALDHELVASRFDADVAVAHRLASGLDPRPMRLRVPALDFEVSLELDPPADRADVAAFAARGPADELHGRLDELGLACTRLAVFAESEHGETTERLWRHEGALSSAAIVERVRWQLEGWLASPDRPSAPVVLLRLRPDEVVPATGRQSGFWGGDADADERARRALARVQGLLGHEAVATAVPSGGRDPAERVRLVPWGDERVVENDGAPWPGRVPAPSPSLVHDPPLAAEVRDARGEPVHVTGRGEVSAPPARLRVGRAGFDEIVAWAGPWPTVQRWWDTKTKRRRARFQFVTGEGRAVLASIECGRWQVEGTYD